ncbi:MAG: hypothetical protein OCD02_15510 [Spirochaetaceae bacterium]
MYNLFGRFCNGFSWFGRTPVGGYIMMGIGLILVIVLIYFIFKNRSISNNSEVDSPLNLLKKRFVNGDIDEAEYLKKKDILEGK